MGFFKDLFKSKVRKEADALNEQWHTLLNTACQQLVSSKYDYGQFSQFLDLIIREYRKYLIDKLAEASIGTSSVGVRKVKTVAYNQPVVYCWTYSDFEKRHLNDLNYQAKNKEFESVINEIKDAAQKKIETEI